MSSHAHVAIDGPAGSGKTTVARALARRLGILYLDTGAMYRALGLLVLAAGVDAADEAALVALATATPVDVTLDDGAPLGFRIRAGGRELGDELYGNDVSQVVSAVAAHPRIRSAMVLRQRTIAETGPVVMAGRDIGTVVLPEAPVKIFLTASVDARTDRRLLELAARGSAVARPLLRTQLVERDRFDRERTTAPLVAAADSVEIDSSELGVEQVVERIAALAGRSSLHA